MPGSRLCPRSVAALPHMEGSRPVPPPLADPRRRTPRRDASLNVRGAGIDLDSDFLIELAAHPNIVGTKFTCGNTGKLTRVALATTAVTAKAEGSGYMAFGGMADFTAQTVISGGSGIIAGGANVLPKTCVRVWDLASQGKYAEAFELQKILSKGDWVLTKAAIPGTKSAIQSYYGYGGFPRRPLKRLPEDKVKAVAEGIREVMDVEKSL